MIRRWLAVGIILLFAGVTVVQGVSENQLLSAKNEKNFSLLEEKTTLICQYYTLSGLKGIQRNVSVQDALRLSKLMNGSDLYAIASELSRLGLLPENLSRQQAMDLMSGKYGMNEFERFQKVANRKIATKSEWKENSFCTIDAYGPDIYSMSLLVYMTANLLDWLLYYLVTIPGLFLGFLIASPLLLMGLFIPFFSLLGLLLVEIVSAPFYIPQMAVEEFLMSGHNFIPLRASPLLTATKLFDVSGSTQTYLKTSGLQGEWSLENYTSIGMYLWGFFGLSLITINEDSTTNVYLKGFCLDVKSKGLDDWDWNPWGDWPEFLHFKGY